MNILDLSHWTAHTERHPEWHWYAIADNGQDKKLLSILNKHWKNARCLLGGDKAGSIADISPHLVSLTVPNNDSEAWRLLLRKAVQKQCLTIIASTYSFEDVFEHLQKFIEVNLPDNDSMYFAFWDPAILATLVGQQDDPTRYVLGPVLTTKQLAYFTQVMSAWWYWDRNYQLHSISIVGHTKDLNQAPIETPLLLTQAQVDNLVEASVPDQVLYYIELNQPHLLAEIEEQLRYQTVQGHLKAAREIKLEAMGDLVNFVCAAVIYKEAFQQDETIQALFSKVKNGEISFNEALAHLP